jgi:signal transduction histidine kinase
VAIVSTALFAANIALTHGWPMVLSATLAFCFAVMFTLIFTVLAVNAERSRGEVQKLADELAAANRKLREYAVEAEELAATRERNRLAREIHDSLGHYLTVVNVQIEAARAVQPRDPVRARDALDKAQSLTQEGLKEIRRSVAALRAMPLDNTSLPMALRQVADETVAAGIQVQFELVGLPRELSPAAELTLYRAAQEGLTNVRKHSGATASKLVLDFSAGEKVRLVISDDGRGAAVGQKDGFGLLGLRERAQLLGGELRAGSVRSSRETSAGFASGFTLELEVPG